MFSFWLRTNRHILVALLMICSESRADEPEPRFQMTGTAQPGRTRRIQSVLEVAGQLKVNADGKQVIPLPLTGKGEFVYDEKLLRNNDAPATRRAARYYHTATSASRVGERDVTSGLSADRPLIVIQADDAKVTLFSPLGPLTREELELIDMQASSVLFERLLPEREVAIGEKWSLDEKLAAALLGLDVVTTSKLESVLKRVEGRTAYIELTGSTSGAVAGVASDIEVTAKYNFDLDKQLVTWLAMSIKEKRAVGHAEPGFELTARLRVSVSPVETSPELSDDALAQLPQYPTAASTWLSFASQAGGFHLLHDRNWLLMVDRDDVTILRLVERGELIAQCNISRLTDAAPGKQLTMQSFQSDIQRVLDKNFGQFVDATESKTDHGLRVLRTVVAGVAADLPIQWNYYHLTDETGRQVSLVFTMDAKLVERFAAADQTLVSSLQIVEKAKPSEGSATAKTAAVPTETKSSDAR